MKKNKVLAAMAASIVAASAFAATALSANAAAETYPESYTVMLAGTVSGIDIGWSNTDAKDSNSVKIDKNGTYTIKVDGSKGGDQGDSTWAMAIRSTDFNAFDYGDDGDDFATAIEKGQVDVKIDSVKINGEEKLNGTASQLIADDDGNNFRVNIYNKWGGNDYAIVDATQSFTGDVEVKFTVSGLKFGDQTAAETTTEAAATTTGSATTTTSGSSTAKATTTKSGEASAKTGDAGVAAAVAALGLAAATAFAVRKKD